MEQAQQDRIWEFFQQDGKASFGGAGARLRWLVDRLPEGARLLDIGVGDGALERYALQRGLDVHALDPIPGSIDALRRAGLGDKAREGSCDAIPWDDGAFDAVIMSEVLEHLTPAVFERTLAEVARVLAQGGRFLGTVPARENLEAARVVCPDCSARFHRWGHEQAFTVASMRAHLAPHFTVETVEERLFVNWTTLNWKGKAHAALRRTLGTFGVRGAGWNVFFAARAT